MSRALSRRSVTGGWSQTWRRVLYSARTSVIITVALVPPLLDQVLRMIGDVPAWLVSLVLVVGMALVFTFLARRELALVSVHAGHGVISRIRNDDWIESLVCTANLQVPLNSKPEPVQTLLRELTGVRSVRLIFSHSADPEESKEALRQWASVHVGRPIEIDSVSVRLDADQLFQDDIDKLSNELRHLDRQHLAVDITGGTKVMTVAAYQAALKADLPVTYIIQRQARGFPGLSALNDPNQVFERDAG